MHLKDLILSKFHMPISSTPQKAAEQHDNNDAIMGLLKKRVNKVSHEIELSQRDSFRETKPKNNTQLVALLSNQELNDLLLEHAKHEYSAENVYIFHEIQEFKKMSDVTNGRRVKALAIVEKYLLDDSEYMVNIDGTIRQRVNAIVQQMENYSIVIKAVREDLFYEVEEAVLANLHDVMTRFVQTPLAPESLRNTNWYADNDSLDDIAYTHV
jgi:hypothetical protein